MQNQIVSFRTALGASPMSRYQLVLLLLLLYSGRVIHFESPILWRETY